MVRIGRFITARFIAIVLSLVMAFTIFPGIASAETGDGADGADGTTAEAVTPDFAPGELIVVTEQDTSKKQMRSIARGVDGQVDTMSNFGDDSKVALIEVEEGSELSAAAELERDDRVLFVQPNYIYELEDNEFVEAEESETDVNASEPDTEEPEAAAEEQIVDDANLQKDAVEYPNDTFYSTDQKQYLASVEDGGEVGTVNVTGAWDQLAELDIDEENKILVAVIDTGVRLTHEDLQGVIIEDKCVTFNHGEQMGFTEGDGYDDDYGHGTAVTGTIGANLNNGTGIAGVAGNRVKMIVIDPSMPDDLSLHSIDIAKGIKYATDEGARLINMSIGYYGRDYICESAIKYAWDRGTLCICSAGNEETPYIHSFGDSPYAITVMSHQWDGVPAENTCYGSEKDVSAPGVSITTTSCASDDSYLTKSGTSFSAPITTGAAALLLVARPNLKPREIKNLLYTSTCEQSFSSGQGCLGFGKINVNTAMENMLAKKTNPKKIVINKQSIEMFKGTKTSIEYAVYPGNTKKTKAKFISSNKKVVTVNSYGVVTAKSPGKATIKVKCGKKYAKCKVTVKKIPYKTIDRKPYCTEGTFTADEIYDVVESTDENGAILDNNVYYYHQYRINMEKDETIQAILTAQKYNSFKKDHAFLRIKDKDGNIVAFDREIFNVQPYALVTFTAEQAGVYQIQAMLGKPSGYTSLKYELKLVSDRSFCKPKVKSINNNQMCMSWPTVEDADYYIVRKYADKELTELEFEETVNVPENTDASSVEYTDTSYDESKVNYYTVTSYMLALKYKDQNGEDKQVIFHNGETPFVVKMQNPMSAEGKTFQVKGKTLKKRSVKIPLTEVMTVEDAEGTVAYKKASGNKKITINKKTGKVTVKKGLKKGTYNVKVNVTASGNEDYRAETQAITFTIIVR